MIIESSHIRKERQRDGRGHRCTNWYIFLFQKMKKIWMNELWNRKVEICNIIKYFERKCDDHGNGDRFIYDLACFDESRFNAHNYILYSVARNGHKSDKNSHSSLFFCEHFIVWLVDLFLIARSAQNDLRSHQERGPRWRRQQSMADFHLFFRSFQFSQNCDFESRVQSQIERWRGHGANTIILWHFVFRKNKIEAQTAKLNFIYFYTQNRSSDLLLSLSLCRFANETITYKEINREQTINNRIEVKSACCARKCR